MAVDRRAALVAPLLLASVFRAATAGEALPTASSELRIGYLDLEGDPVYAPVRGYAGLAVPAREPPLAGAELGARDGRMVAEAAGIGAVRIVRRTLAEGADPAAALREMAAGPEPVVAAVLDLPLEAVVAAARGGPAGLPLFNVRHRDDALRSLACVAPLLLHVLPSRAMLADALAQYLNAKGWRRVLMLRGPEPEDRLRAEAFLHAARKFGVRIVAERPFVPGNDPRQRELNDVGALTAEAEYDVVHVADARGEFARTVPYRVVKPRPVVGDEGLIASAWHPTWERHGAPQLSRRFLRAAGRPMGDEDWAAWVAVRMTVEAVVRGGAMAGLAEALTRPGLAIEVYKGLPASFRPWDRQLRQGVLLHTHTAVVALAPLENFLHQTNSLDTLGVDAPEFRCGG